MDPPLSSTLLPEPNVSLGGSIADLLRVRILSGSFEPGKRLIEAEIARQLQTSRGPVREALAELRAEGLVIDRPRRGSFVVELGADDIRDIYELRAALESRAARLIIARKNDSAIEHLGEIVGELREAAVANDAEGFARLDALFHTELCRLSGNERIHRAFVQNAGVLGALLRIEITTQYDTLDGLLIEHEELFRDISSGDVRRAERGCERHLTGALDRVIRMRPLS